ncbi:acyltransferase [Streptomyces sp. NPDC026672]|uniref:acyltransferase n=1 Tax=unclassified Streptomyces TaxID=2593676 RepID=UPI0033D1145F
MSPRRPSPRTTDETVFLKAGEATGERMRLSVYDLVAGAFNSPRTFYYRQKLDVAALRESLVATLRHYPLITGRLAREDDGGLAVLCTDGGVPFTETYSDRPMPDYGPGVSAKGDLPSYTHKLRQFRLIANDTPLLSVRVTHMEGGGSVLGTTFNHALVDGSAYLGFMKHWSSVHLGQDYRPAPFARTLLDSLSEGAPPEAGAQSKQYELVTGRQKLGFILRVNAKAPQVRTISLRFTADEVGALKEHARSGLTGDQWLSTGDVLGAHLWKVLAELRDRPADRTERLALVISMRSVLAASALPDGYGGNAVTNTTAALSAGELRGASLAEAGLAVRAAVANVTPEWVRDEAAFLGTQARAGRLNRVMSRMARDSFEGTVALNNVSRLPVYELDFGSGTPFWFESPSNPVPWTLLVNPTSAGDDSRDIHFSVPREAADAILTPEWSKRLHAYA